MNRRYNFCILILLALYLTIFSGCSNGDVDSEQPKSTVNYIVTSPQCIDLTVTLLGQVSAFAMSDVRPQVNGIVKERLFTEGAAVKAGQPLYQIDPALYRAAYDNAKAELARLQASATSARLLAQRYAKIVDAGAVSRQENDDAQAAARHASSAVEAARQNLETARINLEYATVTAPVSGIISRSFVTPGALVTAHQPTPLATIQQLDHVYVDVPRASVDLMRWKRALARGELKPAGPDSVRVRLILDDGTPYARNDAAAAAGAAPDWVDGTLLFSEVTMDQSTGMVILRAKFPNPDNVLLPGMYVRAVLEEGVLDDAILVPQRAVVYDQRGDAEVYVLSKESPPPAPQAGTGEEGAPEEKPRALAADEYYVTLRKVAVDRDYERSWLISSGLKSGDLVIVDGLQKIFPGAVVRGVEISPEAPAEGEDSATAPAAETSGAGAQLAASDIAPAFGAGE